MAQTWDHDLLAWVRGLASAQGFDLAGIASAPIADDPEGSLTATRFDRWIEDGHAGHMDYLKRRNPEGQLLRASARAAMPWARSVLVCAFNYNADAPLSTHPAPPASGWIARYAWNGDDLGRSADYHIDLLDRLRHIEQSLQSRLPCHSAAYVDTGPLLERDFAARAGLGWIAKNTCIINQGTGSWLLLGAIVTSLEVPADLLIPLHPDRCGSCTRCIDACPTQALIAPYEMDASRCISYLTIELKSEIPHELRDSMGRNVFGCDICQDVCPWNRRAPIADKPGLKTRAELVNPPLLWLAEMDDSAFRATFKGSPLERTKRRRLQRNVAIAMGNSGDASFIPKLSEWATGEDPILAEAAQWALHKLATSPTSNH